MSYYLITAPTDYPLTLDGVKDYLQETEAIADAKINLLLASATQWVEQFINRALMTQTIEQRFRCWPSCNIVEAKLNPVQSVTIKYIDEDGAEITVDAANYSTWLRNGIMQVSFVDDYTKPTTDTVQEAWKVRFVVGYNPPDTIPDPIKNGILMMTRILYDYPLGDVEQFTKSVENLLRSYKIYQ